MAYNKYTPEQIKEICEAYSNGEKLEILAEKYGTTRTYIGQIALKHGCKPRNKRKSTLGGAKACPKCRKTIDIKGARFCPFCASDIRSSREIAIEKLVGLRKMVMFIPDNCRAEFDDAICTAERELRK